MTNPPHPPEHEDPRAALDVLRGQILAVDAQVGQLMAQRNTLVEDYERRRYAMMGWPPPGTPAVGTLLPRSVPPAVRTEWSGARVRALLLWLGAALLGLSALTFTAVAWSRLGDSGRALLLLAFTAVVTALAVALRRSLPATAEACAGLAIVLVLVDAYAARRAGLGGGMSWQLWWAAGTAVAAGFAATLGLLVGRRTTRLALAVLGPIPAELLIARFADAEWAAALACSTLAAALAAALTGWGRWLYREGRLALGLHAGGCWAAAAVLAIAAAGQPNSASGSLAPTLAVASLAAAPALARRATADPSLRTLLAVVVCAAPAAAVLTLLHPALDDDGLIATSVLAGAVTVLAAAVLPAAWRTAAAVSGALIALPGTLWAVFQATPAVFGPLGWFAEPWTGRLGLIAREVSEGPRSGPFAGSWAAVGTLVVIAAAGLALGIRRRALLGIATAAIALAAALAPLIGNATVAVALITTATVFVITLLAAALVDREQPGQGWALLAGPGVGGVAAAGWSAVTPGASVAALAAAAGAGVAAAVIARPGATREFFAAAAGASAVALAGVAASAIGAGSAAGGFAAAVAAGVLLLAGLYLVRGRAGTVLEVTAAAAALCAVAVAATSTPWLAGSLTALVPVAATAALVPTATMVARRPARRRIYASAAGALALSAVWAWLAAGDVGVVEAYTAPAAAAALIAGILMWRRGPGRSWLTLGPALVLAIGPTLALGLAEDDLARVIAAAVLSLAAVLAGAALRLQAPLVIGAAALLVLALDQWGDEIIRMPRWIVVGVAGALLMWIGATFEHRRRDWRRASRAIGRFG